MTVVLGIVLLGMGLSLAVVVAIAALLGDQTTPTGSSSPAPSGSAPLAPSPSGPAASTPPSDPPAPPTPSPTTPGGIAAGPPTDGVALVAALVSGTTIEVVEVVRWPGGGPATVDLRLPADTAEASGLAVTPEPQVTALQVSVDGIPVVAEPSAEANVWVVTPPSGAAPSTMEVRYLLEGAIVRSVPATPGRALAVLTPISADAAGGLPVGMAIASAGVLNVYCPTADTPTAIRCGRLDGDRWSVVPPDGRPLVVAQIDLPDPL